MCLTPDEKHVRIRGRQKILPLLSNRETFVAPHFSDARDFNAKGPSLNYLDRNLQPSDETRRAHTRIVAHEDGTTRTSSYPDTISRGWRNDAVLAVQRRRWLNRPRPRSLKVDVFESLDDALCDASSFLIATSQGVAVLDNRKHTDPRSLLIPQHDVYRCTGSLHRALMMRPFPRMSDLKSMYAFCTSEDADALFA